MDDKLIGFLYAVVGAAIALLGKWAIDAITRHSEKSNHAAVAKRLTELPEAPWPASAVPKA